MVSAHLKITVCYLKVIHDTKRITNLNVKYEDMSLFDIGNEFALTARSVRWKGGRGCVVIVSAVPGL